jgi:sulfur carrier protein ThiS
MFPNPQNICVVKSSTLRELLEELGSDIVYAYNQHVIVVLVNGEIKWPSSRLVWGDRVTIIPIVTGG